MDISIVIPVYNEAGSIAQLCKECESVLSGMGGEYEIVLVDDGSTDGSIAEIRKLCVDKKNIKAVSFTRNFGQTAALACGFECASGDVIVPMDGDGQNDPADIPGLLKALTGGYDIASGWRKKRKDPWLTRVFPSQIANWLISRITGIHLHDYGCTLKAYRKETVKGIHLLGEMHRFLPAMASWRGARTTEIEVSHRERVRGKSKYSVLRTFKVLLDLVTVKFMGSYATKPIYFFGCVGLLSFLLGLGFLGYLVWDKLAHGSSMIQSPLLLLSAILAVLAVLFVLMGLMAEILVRIYHATQYHGRAFVVRERMNTAEPSE